MHADGGGVDDVRWLCQYLGRLSDLQLHAALVTSGASPGEVRRFARALRARIEQLKNV